MARAPSISLDFALQIEIWRLVAVEFSDALLLFFYIVMVAKRRAGLRDLLLHGEILKLQRAEFINGGDLALMLSLAGVATPCCGAASALLFQPPGRRAIKEALQQFRCGVQCCTVSK